MYIYMYHKLLCSAQAWTPVPDGFRPCTAGRARPPPLLVGNLAPTILCNTMSYYNMLHCSILYYNIIL